MNAPDFKIPRKPRKTPEAPVFVGPSAAYTEYIPDRAMRQAIERAKRDQPPMLALASKVPDTSVSRLRTKP